MTLVSTIAAIAAGRPTQALLQDARLSGGGIEIFGWHSILEFFRSAPVDLDSPHTIIQSDTALTIHAGENAIDADLYDGAVRRLWLLGPTDVAAVQPLTVAVPSELDGTQVIEELLFRAEDYPDLSASQGAQIMCLVPTLRSLLPPHHRARFLIIGAHSQDQRTAILMRSLIASGGDNRQPLDHNWSAVIDFSSSPAAIRGVADGAGISAARRANWRTRLLE